MPCAYALGSIVSLTFFMLAIYEQLTLLSLEGTGETFNPTRVLKPAGSGLFFVPFLLLPPVVGDIKVDMPHSLHVLCG